MGDGPGTPGVGPSRHYRDALGRGRLVYQRCEHCGSAVFPPRVLCPACHGQALRWEPSAGVGTIYSASTLTPRGEDPYTVVLVDLDEGFRLMSVVAGTEVPLGGRVQLTPESGSDPGGEPRLVAHLLEPAGG
ncbi:MAG: zinc ribbon domain-containing protein [Actinomycetota bacterium]|nr:zinc ribbon domain-containing protein [Actinomycetota bacterium]